MLPPVLGVLFDGIAYGMLLFLLSVGLSVTLGLMNFVNLAHCAFAMLGGYVTVILMKDFNWPFFATLPAAFAAAACCDAGVYALLGDRRRLVRVNGSNVISAAVDSVVFPTLAFGQLLPWVIAGQFLAKVGGGAMWSVMLAPFFRKEKKIEYHSE